MKIVALLLSATVLVYLSLDLIDSSKNEQSLGKKSEKVNTSLPKMLPKSLLSIEKKWQDNLKESAVSKAKPKETTNDKFALIIGENQYQLLGIFKEQNKNFVLLKDSEDKIIKLKQQENLPGGYTLAEIDANIIAFVFKEERIEYKLFETKSHAKN